MKQAVNVAITGAAGQIGYALAFRVASGQMLGPDTPIRLHLLEVTPALAAPVISRAFRRISASTDCILDPPGPEQS